MDQKVTDSVVHRSHHRLAEDVRVLVGIEGVVEHRVTNLFGHGVGEPPLELMPHLVDPGAESDRLHDQHPGDRRPLETE